MDCRKAQKADVIWREGDVPVSVQFGDPYFSQADGLAETSHVFLGGNGLPERFVPGFHIAELGFGTGLNLLEAWRRWEEVGVDGPLRFTSFEAFELAPADMARALARWPELAARAGPLLAVLAKGERRYQTETLEFQLVPGDAVQNVINWVGGADAWFLDGFSPARNPAMWSPEIMAAVAAHTRPRGTFATYTAAGHVRRSLQAAGFAVTRAPRFAAKRHMSRGVLA